MWACTPTWVNLKHAVSEATKLKRTGLRTKRGKVLSAVTVTAMAKNLSCGLDITCVPDLPVAIEAAGEDGWVSRLSLL